VEGSKPGAAAAAVWLAHRVIRPDRSGYGRILAAVRVAVGGINWGLIAVAKFDLVATIVGLDFGQTNAASRVVYGLVGASALYQVVQQHAIRRRWSRDPRVATA